LLGLVDEAKMSAGRYTSGPRQGERCVGKEFKSGSVFEEHYFEEELNIVSHSQSIIDDFHAAWVTNRTIVMNTPSVWTSNTSELKIVSVLQEVFFFVLSGSFGN